MFRNVIILLFIITTSVLLAVPGFYPKTMIAEDFGSSSCVSCTDANAGLDVLHNNMHNGEFISTRFYTSSPDLSNADSEARFPFYDVISTPIVIFDGIRTVGGGGADIIDGSTYLAAIRSKRYSASPVKLAITNFNQTTGQASASATMLSPTFSLNNETITFILVENDVTATATHVVRAVLSQPISLTGANNTQDYNATFTIQPAWTSANLWVAAFIQLSDRSIIQAASSLTQPQYQIRTVFPFDPAIVDSAGINYSSPTIYFYNTGLSEDFTVRLIKDSGPLDWYLNYCSEDGICYIGWAPHPFSLAAGDTAAFHLNLGIGSSGSATFHFIIESANMEPYIVPFTYQTSDTPNDDQYLSYVDFRLLQNYPNPFNSNTAIRVLAKKASRSVDINIFNVKGQKVKTLIPSLLNKGINDVEWDGSDDNGKILPQGIYFAQIKGLGAKQTQKMLMLNK